MILSRRQSKNTDYFFLTQDRQCFIQPLQDAFTAHGLDRLEEGRLDFLAGDGQAANLPVLNASEDPDLLPFGGVGQTAVSMPNITEMGAVWGSWNDAVALTITGGNRPENAFTTAAGQIRDLIAGVNVTEGMVNVPGSYQAAAGCDGDWDPTCAVTTAMVQGSANKCQIPMGILLISM